jgi:hypothetical protein
MRLPERRNPALERDSARSGRRDSNPRPSAWQLGPSPRPAGSECVHLQGLRSGAADDRDRECVPICSHSGTRAHECPKCEVAVSFLARQSRSAVPGELLCVDVYLSRVRGRADARDRGWVQRHRPRPPRLHEPRRNPRRGPIDDPRGDRGLHRIVPRARRPIPGPVEIERVTVVA